MTQASRLSLRQSRGKRLRRICRDQDLSVTECANQADRTDQTWRQWERWGIPRCRIPRAIGALKSAAIRGGGVQLRLPVN